MIGAIAGDFIGSVYDSHPVRCGICLTILYFASGMKGVSHATTRQDPDQSDSV